MTQVLIIDDDAQLRRFLTICLTSQGYEVLEATNAEEGAQRCALEQPNLVIMDLGLPDKDGHALLADLRSFFKGPILVLSVRDSEREKVAALDGGANDYIEKPFGANELLARIRSVMRTFDAIDIPSVVYDDGHLRVEVAKRLVTLSGTPVQLSRKEFELLCQLLARPGHIVTQQQLLREIWGEHHHQDTHYLRVFIGRLRGKLGDVPARPKYIQTEAGVGYRFIGKMDGA